ncbi:MAG: ABC transporter ATP-binding protein [Oscillospiraceae bacterium]
MASILRVEQVSKTYQAQNGEIEAIRDISFSVQEGEYISVVGPSGSGKSTLLSIIAGLYAPSGGTVYINDAPVCGMTQDIGYMLQNDNLLEWRSIWKNVLLGLEIRKIMTPETIKYTEDLLRNYGLFEFKDKYPSQLSGGMRQRVALIRTLAVRPNILLLDEAFSALDYQTRLALTDDVYQILKRENKTTIMVTHDIPESISMSDRIVVLSKRPAKIKSIHKIEFSEDVKTPLQRRNNSNFGHYFNEIWKELDVHA